MRIPSFRVLVFLAALIWVVALGAGTLNNAANAAYSGFSGDYVGVLHIEGLITAEGQADGMFSSRPGSNYWVARIEEAADDPSIVGLLLRVNSPGGSAAASQEVFDAIVHYKEVTGNPVVVSMGDVAASGGYYVAAPADAIVANKATLTGSIGVIMSLMNWEGLFEKIGLRENTLKAGRHKDIGSPSRPMTSEERELMQTLLDDVHEQFIEAVAQGRQNLSIDEVRALATGRVWTGRQAREVGLVDELGGMSRAKEVMADKLGTTVDKLTFESLEVQPTLFDMLTGFGFNGNLPPFGSDNSLDSLATRLFTNPILMNMETEILQ